MSRAPEGRPRRRDTDMLEGGVIMVGRDLDEHEWMQAVARDERPRHYAYALAHRCGLRVASTREVRTTTIDRLIGLLIGRSDASALARATARSVGLGEFVYATDESLGVLYLLLSRQRRQRAKSSAMFVMAPHRFRTRFWLRFLRTIRLLPSMIVVGAPEIADALRDQVGSQAEVVYLPVTIDDHFFRPPADAPPQNERPLVISAGLEQRDYSRLAKATRDLDVDVDVCAVSPDRAGAKTQLPEVLPANMQFAPLSISGLRDLYQRADLFVLSTNPNAMSAGLTAVMEALASGLDVVVSTAEPDLADLVADGLVTSTDEPTPEALREVILERLAEIEATPRLVRTPQVRMTADEYVTTLANHFARCHRLTMATTQENYDVSIDEVTPTPAIEENLLSVIIPVAGADDALATQLTALFEQQSSAEFEVVIAHNMPDDAERRRLTEILGPFDNEALWVVEANGRASAAHARNTGAAASRGARLAFCDADDVVHDGWIDAMWNALDDHDAVTGTIVEIAPEGQDDWRPPATPDGLPKFHGAPYVLSGNLGIRRHAFDSVAGFDESLTRCEDIAIGWALQNRGHEIAFAPDAVLDYYHRAGLRKMLQQHYLYGRGMAEVLAKYPNPLHAEDDGEGRRRRLALLKPNAQPHRRTIISEMRRVAIGAGRVVGLVTRR